MIIEYGGPENNTYWRNLAMYELIILHKRVMNLYK